MSKRADGINDKGRTRRPTIFLRISPRVAWGRWRWRSRGEGKREQKKKCRSIKVIPVEAQIGTGWARPSCPPAMTQDDSVTSKSPSAYGIRVCNRRKQHIYSRYRRYYKIILADTPIELADASDLAITVSTNAMDNIASVTGCDHTLPPSSPPRGNISPAAHSQNPRNISTSMRKKGKESLAYSQLQALFFLLLSSFLLVFKRCSHSREPKNTLESRFSELFSERKLIRPYYVRANGHDANWNSPECRRRENRRVANLVSTYICIHMYSLRVKKQQLEAKCVSR